MAIFNIQAWCGQEKVIDFIVESVPRVGETIRKSIDEFYLVEEVIWIYDEPNPNRVNLIVKQYTPDEY